jgi:hypothetical protein
MKYDFAINEVSRKEATNFVQSRHYSKVMPKLTKHYLGCFLGDELVGILTLGWGTQPKQTIRKLFDGLDTDDYFEIGKMCMAAHMPCNSESQMLSSVVCWIKQHCPEKQYLYTWADGIMGKPGYVYQASNFLYGGFIWSDIYISADGEKIHPRSTTPLLEENVKFKLEHHPDFFAGKEPRLYWLTADYLNHKGIRKVAGKQFRYILPLNKRARRHLKHSKVSWGVDYPKDEDLLWRDKSIRGTAILNDIPFIDGNVTTFNSKNVNAHLYGAADNAGNILER